MRDGSADKRSCCSCRGLKYGSQHPLSGWQPSVTTVLGDLVSSSGLHRHQECRMHGLTLKQSTNTHESKQTS